jgi:hypothetical protein
LNWRRKQELKKSTLQSIVIKRIPHLFKKHKQSSRLTNTRIMLLISQKTSLMLPLNKIKKAIKTTILQVKLKRIKAQ